MCVTDGEPATSRAARAAAGAAALSVASIASGVLVSHFGVTEPLTGFRVALGGAALALVGGALGGVGVVTTRSGRRAGRSLAAMGGAWALVVAVTGLWAASGGRGKPRINDITTDTRDPPPFGALQSAEANAGRDMAYPAAFAAEQRLGYADLAPVETALSPAEARERAAKVATALGWTVVATTATGIEATQTSRLFRFVDDVVVRVRPHASGSIVDVRSRSRVGRGDLGVNAARIRAFRAKFADLGPTPP